MCAGTETHHRDIFCVAPELGDVLVDPIQEGPLIMEPQIGDALICCDATRQKAKRSKTVVEAHSDDVLLGEGHESTEISVCSSSKVEGPAVDIDQHRDLLRDLSRTF